VVTDFGIAVAITTAGGLRLTSTGIVIGTPAYMSPEQATGDEAVDARTDIYSLGCVVYEMLTGLPPYVGPTTLAILAQQAAGKVKRPRSFRGDVPRSVEQAVLKSLANTPGERQPTVQDFSRALAAPAREKAIGRWSRMASPKAIVAGAALLVLVVAAALTIGNQNGVQVVPGLGVQVAPGLEAQIQGNELHLLGLSTGEPRNFEDAIARFYRAAELDTSLMPSAYLGAAWSYMMLGRPAQADSLVEIVEQRRDRLAPRDLQGLDLLVSGFLRGDRAAALRVARQLGGIDLAVHALNHNHPQETIQALEGIGPGWSEYWFFLTAAYHMLGNHEGELAAARRARQSDPDRLSHVYEEVQALAALGRVEEVGERIDEALTLPPEPTWGEHAIVMSAGAIELRAHGNRTASLQVAEREIDWLNARPAEQATTPSHRFQLARAYYRAERWEEARVLYEELAGEFPDVTNYQGALGTLAARRGDREEALSISEALVGTVGPYEFGVASYWQANIAALLGERERAISLLRDAFAKGFSYNQYNPHADIDFEPLWDYPPFQEIVRPKG
jgi:tetratricopeptide (TPR) repeat protein